MTSRVAATLVVLFVAACGEGHSRAVASDPPRIVPREAIGAARLGMTRARVERVYADTAKIERLRQWFPAGTRYFGEVLDRRTYRVAGGTLTVSYVRDRVKVLETTSPRYRLPDGTHVGSRIPLRRCSGGGATSACWHNFTVDDCTDLLVEPRLTPTTTYIAIRRPGGLIHHRRYSIARIGFGYGDVVLLCF